MSLDIIEKNCVSNVEDYYSDYFPKMFKGIDTLNENIQNNNIINNQPQYEEKNDDGDNLLNDFYLKNEVKTFDSFIDYDDQRNYQKTKAEDNTEVAISEPRNKIMFSVHKVEIKERKKGRITIGNTPLYKPKHNKNSTDNIIMKIKRLFVKKTMEYINKKFDEFLSEQETEIQSPLLKKINPDSYNIYKTKENQEFFNLYLYQLFSKDLSDKIKKSPKEYNREQLKLLYEENKAKEVIEIMDLTVKEMYEIYLSGKITDYNLENDLIGSTKNKEKKEEDIKNGKNGQEKKENIEYENIFKNKSENLINFLFRKRKMSSL